MQNAFKLTSPSSVEGPPPGNDYFWGSYWAGPIYVDFDEWFKFGYQFTGWRRFAGSWVYRVYFCDEISSQILGQFDINVVYCDGRTNGSVVFWTVRPAYQRSWLAVAIEGFTKNG